MIIGSGTRERTYDRDGRTWTRWEAWVEYERRPDGRRRRKRSDHLTERLAEAWVRSMIAEDVSSPGSGGSSDRVTVGQLLDAYLEHGETVAVWSPSHARNTRRIVERYLATLRTARALGLEPEDVDELVAGLVRRKVSPHTIRQVRNALRAAFNLAIRRRRIPQGRNPAAIVDVPRTTRRAPSFVAPDQLGVFIQKVEGDWLGPLYITCALLALRPSEALALRWSDVVVTERTVTIERSVHRKPGKRQRGAATRDSGGTYEVRPTKTHAVRTLHVPPSLMARLTAHRKRMKDAGLKTGPTALVFPNRTGGYVFEPYARGRLRELLEGTPLAGVTMYQLRHTGITLRGFAGVPLSVIQEEAGHSNINQTRRYQQLVEAQRRQSANALETLVNAAQGTNAPPLDDVEEPTVGRTTGRTDRPTPTQRRRAQR